jgi:hypothetical protein
MMPSRTIVGDSVRDICFRTRRLKFLPFIVFLLLSCPAGAADGPCELEAGMWASPVEACQYVMKPSEAVSRYGDRALLELHPRLLPLRRSTMHHILQHVDV